MSATTDPPDPRPQRADARRNRERIVEAARDVFATRGTLAQIDEIASRAGVGVGTVYRHFPNKDALAGELVRQKFEEIGERLERWVAREDVAPWDAFAGCMMESAEKMSADAAQQRLIWEVGETAFAHAAPAMRHVEKVAGELIGRAQAAGDLRGDFSHHDISTFMCALGGGLSSRQSERGGFAWQRLVEVWLDGLRVR